jgi:hypothetical protein
MSVSRRYKYLKDNGIWEILVSRRYQRQKNWPAAKYCYDNIIVLYAFDHGRVLLYIALKPGGFVEKCEE